MARLRVTERDKRLVRNVFLHRVARRDDLIGLGHFKSVPRCNFRLAQLVSAGWLRRIEDVNGLRTHQTLYASGPAAAGFLSQSLDLPPDEVSRHCHQHEGPILVEHALRTLEFRIRMQAEELESSYAVKEWLCEPECLHEFEYRPQAHASWTSIVIKPDGYVRLGNCGNHLDFFIETDLGHVSLPRFQQKLERYDLYLQCGAFEEVYGPNDFAVLTVTVGERRLSHLTSLGPGSVAHLVTTWKRIEADGIFRCRWTIGKEQLSLTDLIASGGQI